MHMMNACPTGCDITLSVQLPTLHTSMEMSPFGIIIGNPRDMVLGSPSRILCLHTLLIRRDARGILLPQTLHLNASGTNHHPYAAVATSTGGIQPPSLPGVLGVGTVEERGEPGDVVGLVGEWRQLGGPAVVRPGRD